MADKWPATPSPRVAVERPAAKTARQLRADEMEALVTRYQDGAKIKELASEFGIGQSTVHMHLNRHGVERRVRGFQSENVAQATDLYRAGWSLASIGEKFGTTAKTVWTRLLEAGVQMREPWERP